MLTRDKYKIFFRFTNSAWNVQFNPSNRRYIKIDNYTFSQSLNKYRYYVIFVCSSDLMS